MCVDIHPQHPHMVVAGLYDGNVAVYNLQTKQGKPSYLSHPHNGKHKEVVWQVKWVKDNLDGYLNFYSVAGDGRVTNWTIVKTKLWFNDELKINFSKGLVNSDNSSNQLMDSGRALTFKPDDETLFLVGTEEGIVHLATTQYSSQFLMTYPAHSTPINNLHWNPYLPEIFLTCASEFVVKIFHRNSTKPILRFDVGSQVGDCSWSPYSSTVFAVVSQEGKVFVYDLDVNKYNPICTQAIVPRRRARLNHISFNPSEPLIIVGDSCGHVHSLKLSPNLRRMNKETQQAILNKEPNLVKAAEIRKLEKLLEQVVTTPVLESDSGDENQE
ncbi:dynein intermediate chain 1, axonemal [Eurytemora carolleeae]|uniref:dynein intermediate chain 1, axonemal n=1 Tax=Eurytemora carolleeae TaxID=1294199 RepID=UPI000C773E52|nr:dynein intermediate chain 1, axonemal [Eurytemora carolleeae]|eukprot:XP_023325697.1 dynein intermediate chain 1, axonemal-like [Eurytemora affinis]